LTYSSWTAKDGLSSSNVTKVISDQHGQLWIGSYNGFMRFDSERIDIYDKKTEDLLETDGVNTLLLANDESIYLGSQGTGLLHLKNGELSIIKSDLINIPKSVRAIYQDESGNLFFGGQNTGLLTIQKDTAYIFSEAQLAGITIISIKADKIGGLWIGTEGRGLFYIKDDKVTNYNISDGLVSNYVSDIFIDEQNETLFCTSNGVQKVINNKVRSIPELAGLYINVFYVDDWGTYWLGGETGLYRYHPKDGKLEEIKHKKDISFVRISSLYADKEGNLWLTSNRSGLVQIKESIVTNISYPEIQSELVNIVYENKSGHIMIGTDQNHINIWDGENISTRVIKTPLKGNGIRNILEEEDGTLWLATYNGIVKVQGNRESLIDMSTGMPANNFRVIKKDINGYFWFATRSGGLVKYKDEKINEIFDLNNKLLSNFILALATNDLGEVYVGTNGGGMSIISADGEVKNYKIREDDSGILIFNIDLESNGNAILTTNVGPAYFDGEKIIQVPLESFERSSTFFDIVWDQKDHLWVTTNIGILKIEKKNWNAFVKGDAEKVFYTVLNESDGMNNRECTGATSALLGSDGLVYVPTLGGVAIVNPELKITREIRPSIKYQKVKLDDREVSMDETIILNPEVNRLSIDFSLVSFGSIGQHRYRYQLIGFDDELSPITDEPTIQYTNVPPGEYEFIVAASEDGQLWLSASTVLAIQVLPHYYQTYWFLVLATFTVLFTLYAIYQWRLSFINRQNIKLTKVNAELDRFVYSASHELRSPLTSVLGLVRLARTEESGNINEYLDHIESSVMRLDSFIKDIIDYSRNTRLENFRKKIDFDAMIRGILEDISYSKNFTKISTSFENKLSSDFYSDDKRLKIAFSNLINNAVKHHDPSRVENPYVNIILTSSDVGIIVEITDNGPGIEKEYQDDIFKMFFRATVRSEGSGLGLYIVHEIIQRVSGTIELSSTFGVGTSFILKLPNLQKKK
jgi:signal transduction histidine kinase/ligand-binding sensor domain-containing protein